MATNAPFDTVPLLTDAFTRFARGLLRKIVREELRAAGIGPNGPDVSALLGDLAIPTGRAIVAKSSPLKVEFPASPAVMTFEGNQAPTLRIKALWAFVYTAPTGAAITVQIKKWKGGSYSNVCQPSDLLTIAAGANFGMLDGSRLFDDAVARGDWFLLDVQSVGSTVKGDLLTVQFEYDAPIRRGRDF